MTNPRPDLRSPESVGVHTHESRMEELMAAMLANLQTLGARVNSLEEARTSSSGGSGQYTLGRAEFGSFGREQLNHQFQQMALESIQGVPAGVVGRQSSGHQGGAFQGVESSPSPGMFGSPPALLVRPMGPPEASDPQAPPQSYRPLMNPWCQQATASQPNPASNVCVWHSSRGQEQASEAVPVASSVSATRPCALPPIPNSEQAHPQVQYHDIGTPRVNSPEVPMGQALAATVSQEGSHSS